MHEKYGFIPLGDLILRECDKGNENIQNIVCLHKTIKDSGCQNVVGPQIKVHSYLNYKAWEIWGILGQAVVFVSKIWIPFGLQ